MHPRYSLWPILHNIMKYKDLNCINPRFQMISCIGIEMVKIYFKLFLGKIYSKCLSYTGESHIFIIYMYVMKIFQPNKSVLENCNKNIDISC